MKLPIYAYGHPILKRIALPVENIDETLQAFIENMWETMYQASGVGLAAPQVGVSKRIFVVDTIQLMDDEEKEKGIKKVFINPIKIEEAGEEFAYEEGCLSIPDVRADVNRQRRIKLSYRNENFEEQTEVFEGVNARVIQHEYDHIEGILFVERINPLKRNILRRKLDKIRKGKVDVDYPMHFV
jgi:peptide deformylase